MDADAVRDRAADLPRSPGVYRFLDGERTLYVGKAVDLRSRVRSYADPRSRRIARMVERAGSVDVAVTDTETQALLLEANLIKRDQPRYNVRLKDDKSYPLVQLTAHEFPRIEVTRDPADDATVFGPFTDKGRVETVVKALRETYGVRGCSDHKFAGRDRPCLDYDLGLCTAPCTGEIGVEGYLADVRSVERFLEGETGVLSEPLRREMATAAEDRNFERAANCRDRLDAVEAFHGQAAAAISDERGDGPRVVDVLGAAVEGERATVARLHAEGGKLVERDHHTLTVPEDSEADAEVGAVLGAFVAQYYADEPLPDAIFVPEPPDDDDLRAWLDGEGVEITVPGAGREATLVDLAVKNAHRRPSERDAGRALADLLGTVQPNRIEGFDVSHAQGKATVGSDVTFVDGEPVKADYRRKRLPDGNDDPGSMETLLRWRAERAVEGRDDRPDPDLVLIDGGQAQLSAARTALDAVGWDVPVIALAKADERIVTPDASVNPPNADPGLSLLRRIRDEAHRFAVQYHGTLRDEVSTVLDGVDGIGPETRKRLLQRFGSVEAIREASEAELRTVDGVGEKTARTIVERL